MVPPRRGYNKDQFKDKIAKHQSGENSMKNAEAEATETPPKGTKPRSKKQAGMKRPASVMEKAEADRATTSEEM